MSFARFSTSLMYAGVRSTLFLPVDWSNDTTFPQSYSLFRTQYTSTILSRLRIFQGTFPTQSTLSSYASYPDAYNTANVLLTFTNMGGGVSELYDETVVVGDVCYLRSKTVKYATASASGTATWFMWYNSITNSSNAMNNYGSVFAGDITGPGGGGALEIDDTSIVSGQSYQLKNYSFALPRAWTFV